mmetsp:Transcript_19432/g.56434  ORF Transcript_19432/g.56434 Transcript_19432/m.56434 type:complete len:215 (+) Transcript_19432:1692-2336(+)
MLITSWPTQFAASPELKQGSPMKNAVSHVELLRDTLLELPIFVSPASTASFHLPSRRKGSDDGSNGGAAPSRRAFSDLHASSSSGVLSQNCHHGVCCSTGNRLRFEEAAPFAPSCSSSSTRKRNSSRQPCVAMCRSASAAGAKDCRYRTRRSKSARCPSIHWRSVCICANNRSSASRKRCSNMPTKGKSAACMATSRAQHGKEGGRKSALSWAT